MTKQEIYQTKRSRKPRHKFKAVRTELDGYKFPSKKQAAYYSELKLKVQAGLVLFFLMEVPIRLPGGVVYRCDFVEFYADGEVRFIDVKGFRTKEYIIKKKMVESLYPFKIIEV